MQLKKNILNPDNLKFELSTYLNPANSLKNIYNTEISLINTNYKCSNYGFLINNFLCIIFD
jgi:hypothetical protein